MKKILFALLSAFAFVSCSKDSEDLQTVSDNLPKTGLYLYSDDTITAEINLGNSVAIVIYQNGLNFYQSTAGVILGDWPTYEYKFSGITLICTYSDSKTFSAWVENGTALNLPKTMNFTHKQ